MRLHEEKLPGFVQPIDLIRSAAGSIRPPASVTVSECAEKHIRLNNPGSYVGPYKNSMAPYLVEPMDRSVTRSIDELHMVAPSQSGKSQLFLNVIAHGIKYKPGDILLVQPGKEMAIDFSERRVQKKMLDISPDLSAELGTSRSDDKVLNKAFRNGLMLTVAWPVPAQLASRAVPTVIFDEEDRMPEDIGGEGSPIELGRNRKRSYGRNGSLINVSSPSKDYKRGIVGHYYEGDQRLWFWQCPSCDEYFSPGFGFDRKPTLTQLQNHPNATPAEAGLNSWMVCPHCGGPIEEKLKKILNGNGVWLALGQKIDRAGNITGQPIKGRIASYWLSGFAAMFVGWGELNEKYLKAQAKFDQDQDENDLKTVINTGFGFPYTSRQAGAAPLEIEEFEGRKEDYALKTVPGPVRFLVGSVDVGAHKFDMMVIGFDENGQSWLIDRYTLKQAPDGRPLDPANILRDWKLLDPLIKARYPLSDHPGKFLPVGAVAIDNGGAAGEDEAGNVTSGVSVMGKDYARGLYQSGMPYWQVRLIKGASQRQAPILPQRPTWERDDNGKKIEGSVPLHVIGVHNLKNIIDTRLRLTKVQPGYMHFPKDPPANYFKELTGERKIKGKWHRKGANESFDLHGYCEALRQMLRPDRVDWKNPPVWAAIINSDHVDPEVLKVAPITGRRVRSRGI